MTTFVVGQEIDILGCACVVSDIADDGTVTFKPKRATLREKVARTLLFIPEGWPHGDQDIADRYADVVLKVIVDDIRKLVGPNEHPISNEALDAVIARLRGER